MSTPWKESNLALIGSDLDKRIKSEAAELEEAWEGMGENAPETRVWRIEKFKVVPWPEEHYGKFHKGDSYIVLHTYKEGDSDALHHDLHIWIGSESSQDEYGTAAYKMVEADDFLKGVPIQHREVQGHESDTFASYFDSHVQYLDGGIESGFNHVEPTPETPFLFRVKGTKKNMHMTQVPLSKDSLNSGDSFILMADKGTVWCWHGTGAKPMEKARCNQWAERMCSLGTAVVMDQGQGDEEYKDFWDLLGEGTIGPEMGGDEEVEEFTPLLFRVDGDPSTPLEKVAEGSPVSKTSAVVPCLQKSDLNDSDVFLLDSGWEIFIWIGSGADLSEKVGAMGAADRYGSMEPRAYDVPVSIIKAGQETNVFNSYFE